jgi:hypothetical protein
MTRMCLAGKSVGVCVFVAVPAFLLHGAAKATTAFAVRAFVGSNCVEVGGVTVRWVGGCVCLRRGIRVSLTGNAQSVPSFLEHLPLW